MTKAKTTPTRIDTELLDAAREAGEQESRSATQQVAHWARLGRAVSSRHTNQRRRVEAALEGTLPLSQLSAEEREVVNAEHSVAIREQAQVMSFGARLAAEGVTTVALDDGGRLVEHHPDGTTSVIE